MWTAFGIALGSRLWLMPVVFGGATVFYLWSCRRGDVRRVRHGAPVPQPGLGFDTPASGFRLSHRAVQSTAWSCEACGTAGVIENDAGAGVYAVLDTIRRAHAEASDGRCTDLARVRVDGYIGRAS